MQQHNTAAEAATLAPTSDHRPNARAAVDSFGRFKVVRAGGVESSRFEDVCEQLRKRLRFIACVAAAGCACGMLLTLTVSSRDLFPETWHWHVKHGYLLTYVLLLACQTGAIVGLAPSRHLTFRALQRLEMFVFATICLFLIDEEAEMLVRNRDILSRAWASLANASALTYSVTLVAYGVLIPNTSRRCAWGVGLILAAGYVGSAFGFAFGPQTVGVISTYLIQKTIWLGMAGAIVIYGAFRIEALREAADRGRELGQYRLQRILGTGGMGSVYSAEHVLLRRPCAIKLIRPDRAADPGSLARFEREVQATAALTHPHVVRIYDYGRTDDGTFYCVMEYLSGVTLDQLVRQHGVLSADRTVFILRQLCSALAEAHAAGLTHRDVKPGNVIVRDGGRQADFATLLDFGLVLDRTIGDDKLTTEGTLIGTPSFMSPEQAAGETVDGRSDLYAIGAVGHFLLTGRPPFAGGSTIRTVAAVLTEPPPPLGRADVPENLEAVLRRCLAKRPAERFQSADELDAALAGCCCDDWSHRRAAEWWPGLTVNSDVAAAGSETGTLV